MKPTETQSKAFAGAVSGFLISLVPVLVGYGTGGDVTGDQIAQLQDTFIVLATTLASTLFGWGMVYFAPKNKPLS